MGVIRMAASMARRFLLAPATAPLAAALLLAAAGSAARATDPAEDGAPPVDFQRQIRPLLADRCFTCHGPDDATREADLRLDVREAAFADRGGYAAVVPGASDDSELLRRVSDPDDPMPPRGAGEPLTADEVALVERWIDEGAPWSEHWAFVAPVRPEPPAVERADWPAGDVDRFVLARLEAAGLAPSPEAARETLARRVTLDLTGLPPALDELDAFLADDAPGAYERLVDRLLASPRFGEALAREWLDAARYGDTHGFHFDNERSLWPWRDWVIDAFNDNKPFDAFTVEQLAGDLLAGPTTDQLVATGFNRCNPTTGEGGLIEDEYLVRYAVDRVDTTATVWMGLTMGCAQCHDHKYDPISQREFYSFFAFFNSVDESANDGNALVPPPSVAVPSPEQAARKAELELAIAALEHELDGPLPAVDAAQAQWERDAAARERWLPLDPLLLESSGGSALRLLDDGSVLATGPNPERDTFTVVARVADARSLRALRLELLPDASFEEGGVGRAENGNVVLARIDCEVAPAAQPGALAPLAWSAAYADYEQMDFPARAAIDADPETGWAIDGRSDARVALFVAAAAPAFDGPAVVRVRLQHESRFARHVIGRFRLSVAADETLAPATLGPWRTLGPFEHESASAALAAQHDVDVASSAWTERADFGDGVANLLAGERCATYVHRTIESPEARALEVALGSDDGLAVLLNGELLLERDVLRPLAPDQERVRLPLRAGTNELVLKVANEAGGYGFRFRVVAEELGGLPLGVARVLALAPDARTDAERVRLRDHYRANHAPAWRERRAELDAERAALAALDAQVPRTMVMRERAEPRPARVLARGSYATPGDPVEPGVPSVLPPLESSDGARATRLELARWLVRPDHPLTARVAVNRAWLRYFGRGLVASAEDFGTRGAHPTHPELLDWLATEFVRSGWDVKALHRLIVTSATYRQSSRARPDAAALDPANALLARAPRLRLPAEAIRDGALAIGGLLVERVGGPSVRPYQPSGLWRVVAYPTSNTATFQRGEGDALWRRSLYTFWKRTSPPPTMALFDAPTRESCTVRRARTNTPLQALALMNDEQFVEAARTLAERMLRASGGDDAATAAHGFRLATSRAPDADEVAVLVRLARAQREELRADPAAAHALLAVGEAPVDESFDPVELAAWTLVASAILNLDETITRG